MTANVTGPIRPVMLVATATTKGYLGFRQASVM